MLAPTLSVGARKSSVVTGTHLITLENLCPRPLNSVILAGPTTGYTDTLYAFTATITPANAIFPITGYSQVSDYNQATGYNRGASTFAEELFLPFAKDL